MALSRLGTLHTQVQTYPCNNKSKLLSRSSLAAGGSSGLVSNQSQDPSVVYNPWSSSLVNKQQSQLGSLRFRLSRATDQIIHLFALGCCSKVRAKVKLVEFYFNETCLVLLRRSSGKRLSLYLHFWVPQPKMKRARVRKLTPFAPCLRNLAFFQSA